MASFDKWREENIQSIEHLYKFAIHRSKNKNTGNFATQEAFEYWLFVSQKSTYKGRSHRGYPLKRSAASGANPIYPLDS